ncbi:hypothetical protein [Acidocella sp.]|uniref:hypothetical protein n=1 Tax=Acidocella sp. TaxID=50710 RepID=UPI003CFC3A0B
MEKANIAPSQPVARSRDEDLNIFIIRQLLCQILNLILIRRRTGFSLGCEPCLLGQEKTFAFFCFSQVLFLGDKAIKSSSTTKLGRAAHDHRSRLPFFISI